MWAAHCRGEGGKRSRLREMRSREPLLKQGHCEGNLKHFYEHNCHSQESEEPLTKICDVDSAVISKRWDRWDLFRIFSSLLNSTSQRLKPLLSTIYKAFILKSRRTSMWKRKYSSFPPPPCVSSRWRSLPVRRPVQRQHGYQPTTLSPPSAIAASPPRGFRTRLTHLQRFSSLRPLDGRHLLHPSISFDYLDNVSLFCKIASSFHSLKPSLTNFHNLALRIRQRIHDQPQHTPPLSSRPSGTNRTSASWRQVLPAGLTKA